MTDKATQAGPGVDAKARRAATDRAYYLANREKIMAYKRAWLAANRQRALDLDRAWRAQNREKHLTRRRARYLAHAEELRAARRAYGQSNRAKEAASQKAYNLAHPEMACANSRKRRARKAMLVGHATVEQIRARWVYYGNKCWMCGGKATCTDHVKPLCRGGSDLASNLRLACRGCNAKKASKWPFKVER